MTTDGKSTRTLSEMDLWYAKLIAILPWCLLLPSTVISQLAPGQSLRDRAITLSLAALAAVWVYFGHNRVPIELRDQNRFILVYFIGLLAIALALVSRDIIFILFVITGFFHAYLLRPWPLGVAGVFVTSLALNGMVMDIEPTAQSIGTFISVVGVQSAAVGAGIFFGQKASKQYKQREEMVAKLEAALEENAGLHAQLLAQAREAGVLDERQRMAREIHDTLAQGIAGIVTQVQAAQRLWDTPELARPHLDRALALAKESLAEARRSVQALGPRELEKARLPDALRDFAERWAQGVGVRLSVEVTGESIPLSPPIEVALFRVTQEALTNVAKHANATRVGVTLSYLEDVVLLDVRDDGVGFRNSRRGGFGLNSMRQRVRSVGGSMEIESAPGEGTAISVSVPAIPASAA